MGFFIAVFLILGAWAVYFIYKRLPPVRELPVLYVIVAKDTQNTEWLIRYIFRQTKNWRLKIVCPTKGEERAILERLNSQYGFELLDIAPAGMEFKLEINKKSKPKELKKELGLLNAKIKRKGNPLPRRI